MNERNNIHKKKKLYNTNGSNRFFTNYVSEFCPYRVSHLKINCQLISRFQVVHLTLFGIVQFVLKFLYLQSSQRNISKSKSVTVSIYDKCILKTTTSCVYMFYFWICRVHQCLVYMLCLLINRYIKKNVPTKSCLVT